MSFSECRFILATFYMNRNKTYVSPSVPACLFPSAPSLVLLFTSLDLETSPPTSFTSSNPESLSPRTHLDLASPLSWTPIAGSWSWGVSGPFWHWSDPSKLQQPKRRRSQWIIRCQKVQIPMLFLYSRCIVKDVQVGELSHLRLRAVLFLCQILWRFELGRDNLHIDNTVLISFKPDWATMGSAFGPRFCSIPAYWKASVFITNQSGMFPALPPKLFMVWKTWSPLAVQEVVVIRAFMGLELPPPLASPGVWKRTRHSSAL